MNRQLINLLLLCGCLATPLAQADTSKTTQTEIDFLLGYINVSGCQFYRNGSWYDAKAAEAHLRSKYQYLTMRNQIGATEDFIEKAASKSSFSGQVYQVGCKGEPIIPSGQWLRAILARYRSTNPPP